MESIGTLKLADSVEVGIGGAGGGGVRFGAGAVKLPPQADRKSVARRMAARGLSLLSIAPV
jgi:hypothetical protein